MMNAARCSSAVARQLILLVWLLLGTGRVLVAQSADPPSMPVARHEVRLEKTVMVPMRDGVRLSTDLYFPIGAGERLPVILMRTPYNKKSHRREGSAARMFAGQGYVVSVQDVRGKWESEGAFALQGGDVEDGYDSVEWLARQPWSNGKVGTYGCSYLGDVQVMMAQARPPALTAQIPQAAGSSNGPVQNRFRYFGVRNGGAIELAASVGWFPNAGSKLFYRPPPDTPDSIRAKYGDYFNPGPQLPPLTHRELWWKLPVVAIMDSAGVPPTDFETVVSIDPASPWWSQFGYLKGDERFDVPALHVNSWYDFGVAETLLQFNLYRENAISERARTNQYAIISPTVHCASERATQNTVVGRRAVGDARLEYWSLYLDWFDHWLRGGPRRFAEWPRVRYYLMGTNEWKSASAWPIPGTRFTPFYLRGGGRANSRFGDGWLSTERPGNEPPDRYTYDPAAPVPSLGGPICCTGTPDAPEGAFDQAATSARSDVLVYTTPPLSEGLEVTGPLQVVLYVSSSAPDTDFTAKLIDVYPDGTAFNVQEGILRARYREGFDRQVFMKPSGVYKLTVDLQATGNYFAAGHRIRLEISSSNFPRFDRNLNTGGNNYDEVEWIVAENVVYHSDQYPSHILLPIVPAR